jgi:hypothetical protein
VSGLSSCLALPLNRVLGRFYGLVMGCIWGLLKSAYPQAIVIVLRPLFWREKEHQKALFLAVILGFSAVTIIKVL